MLMFDEDGKAFQVGGVLLKGKLLIVAHPNGATLSRKQVIKLRDHLSKLLNTE